MTKITLQEGGGKFRLTATGHATGSREVCAAVSGLVYALGGRLLELEEAGRARVTALRLESGEADIEAEGEGARDAFAVAGAGFSQLAGRYPDYIRKNDERRSTP